MKSNVLVATEDTDFRDRVAGEAKGLCRIISFPSVVKLLRKCEARHPTVVILDSTLPGVDGLEILHTVRHIVAPDTFVIGVGPLDLTGILGAHHTRRLISVRRAAKPVAEVLRALLDPSAPRTIREVRYQAAEDAFFVAFRDGKTYELARRVIEADDGSRVVRARVEDEGDAFVVEQRSGNRYDVAWDFVLHHVGQASGHAPAEPPAVGGWEAPAFAGDSGVGG